MLNKRRVALLFSAVFMLFFISACSKKSAGLHTEKIESQNAYMIYYMNTAGTKIQGIRYKSERIEPEAVISELLKELSKPPEELGLKQAIPDDISILSYQFEEDTVTLYFGEDYNGLTGVTEVLRRAAVVKTLTQINGVKFVQYMVGGQPLLYSDMLPVGRMKADDFIDNTGGETTYYQTVHLTLYYTDEIGEKLFPTRHHVEFDGTISMENLILKQLMNGPLPEENLKVVIPEGSILNKVTSKDGICYVDFSKEFLAGVDGVSNQVVIYSIVNSLSEIGSVTKVIITVNGENLSSYRGEVALDMPLERKLEFIEKN